jgi:AcrR family transcriptional regulator
MPRRRANDPRKTPRRARSRDICDAVLEATARILETNGLEAANTNAIAERAGIGVGSLGRYVPGRTAIFAEPIRRNDAATDEAPAAAEDRIVAGVETLLRARARDLARPPSTVAARVVRALFGYPGVGDEAGRASEAARPRRPSPDQDSPIALLIRSSRLGLAACASRGRRGRGRNLSAGVDLTVAMQCGFS